jgi:hypothetical protein
MRTPTDMQILLLAKYIMFGCENDFCSSVYSYNRIAATENES